MALVASQDETIAQKPVLRAVSPHNASVSLQLVAPYSKQGSNPHKPQCLIRGGWQRPVMALFPSYSGLFWKAQYANRSQLPGIDDGP